jgi:hypothetical protein
MKFPIPEGMVPPDGVTEGSTFDALATLRLEADGLTLVAIDGLPVAEAEDDAEDMAEDKAEMSEEMGFDEAIRSGMTGE